MSLLSRLLPFWPERQSAKPSLSELDKLSASFAARIVDIAEQRKAEGLAYAAGRTFAATHERQDDYAADAMFYAATLRANRDANASDWYAVEFAFLCGVTAPLGVIAK